MLLRLAVTKERRALACRTLYQWMRTSWKSLRDSSRAVATMGATRRWMQAGMARGRQGNLWAAPARRPVLTLAQLLRLRKETMEKLAWLVLIHRRTVLVSYLQTWRGKLASWRLLRSFLPNALSNLTASKASKRNEAVRPMWRVWEVAGSALLHRMWLDRALKSAMAVFRHHTSRCKLLRRSFGRLRNKRRVALSKDTLETWRLGIASAQTMQKLERLLSRERVRRNRRVALQAMMGWRCVGQMQQRLRRLSCLVQARAARREMKGFLSKWSSLARWVRQQCDPHKLVCVSFRAWLDAASCCKHVRHRRACFLRRSRLRSIIKAFQLTFALHHILVCAMFRPGRLPGMSTVGCHEHCTRCGKPAMTRGMSGLLNPRLMRDAACSFNIGRFRVQFPRCRHCEKLEGWHHA